MRSNTVVGHGLHFIGTNLDFNGYPVHAKQGGVQRLITIHFGNGDVILKLSGHWLVETMDGAKDAITRVNLIGDDTKSKYIGNLVK